jgi:hypothetical protein
MQYLIIVLMAFLIGCEEEQTSKSNAESCTESVRSFWVFQEDTSVVIGMTNLDNFETSDQNIFFSDGAQCALHFYIDGGECSGQIHIVHSEYVGGGSDPGCESFEGVANYSISDRILSMCNPDIPENCDLFDHSD